MTSNPSHPLTAVYDGLKPWSVTPLPDGRIKLAITGSEMVCDAVDLMQLIDSLSTAVESVNAQPMTERAKQMADQMSAELVRGCGVLLPDGKLLLVDEDQQPAAAIADTEPAVQEALDWLTLRQKVSVEAVEHGRLVATLHVLVAGASASDFMADTVCGSTLH
jgi:hypothetical protein